MDAALPQGVQGVGHGGRRNQHHGQIHRVGDIRHAGVDGAAKEAFAFGVEKVNGAAVAALHQIARQGVAQLGGVAGYADDQHALRLKKGDKGRVAHAVSRGKG